MKRRRHACLLAAALALLAPGPTAAAATPQENPSAHVNVCGPKGTGDVGVRVDVPYRGDSVAPWVRITIQYQDEGSWRQAKGGDSGWFQAGPEGTGAETGYTFPYRPPEAGGKLVMRGVAEIEWRAGGDAKQLVTATCEVDSP